MSQQYSNVIYNDDGCSLRFVNPTDHNEAAIARVFDFMDGSHINRVCWCVFCGWMAQNWYSRRIENYFDLAENAADHWHGLLDCDLVYQLYKREVDYLPLLITAANERGKEFFASFRMNDCHLKSDPRGALSPRFWRDNQDKRIWELDGTLSYFNACMDYTFSEVRELVYNAIDEFVTRYPVDGVELDFMRQEWAFAPSEAWAKREILTELIARINERLARGNSAGRPVKLMVRIPGDEAGRRAGGFDVAEWMRRGIIELAVAGVNTVDFTSDITGLMSDGKRYAVSVYGDLELFSTIQPCRRTTQLCGEQSYAAANFNQERPIKAIVEEAWGMADELLNRCGVDGLYMFNYPCWRNDLVCHGLARSAEDMAVFAGLLRTMGGVMPPGTARRYNFWAQTPLYAEAMRPARPLQHLQLHLGAALEPDEKLNFSLRCYIAPNPHAEQRFAYAGSIKKILEVLINEVIISHDRIVVSAQAAGVIPSGCKIGAHELWQFTLTQAELESPDFTMDFRMPGYPDRDTPYIYIHDLEVLRLNT